MAEWTKALVLGTSLFGGMGSNPTAAKFHFFFCSLLFYSILESYIQYTYKYMYIQYTVDLFTDITRIFDRNV